MRLILALLLALLLVLLLPAGLAAQPTSNQVVSTLKATSSAVDAVCIGCPVATQVPAAQSGARLATITIDPYAAPSVTTNKLYNIAGALQFNGVTLATGSTISGTTGTIGMFTGVAAMGNSLLTQSGSVVTMAGTLAATLHSGSGASLTNIPTSALTGNYVATLTAGTGLTISAGAGTGTGSTPTLSLANTAVTPSTYGSATQVPQFTVDQQGRLTLATQFNLTALDAMTTVSELSNGSVSDFLYLRQFGSDSGFKLGIDSASTGAMFISSRAGGTDTAKIWNMTKSGAVSLGGVNVTDAVATPTISADCGTGSTIVGKAYAFKVTMGTGSPNQCNLAFNATFANAPVCVAVSLTATQTVQINATTTTLQLLPIAPTTFSNGSAVLVQCRGY